MKYDLVKFHHWLLLSTFRNKWFEENIKLQIISLLSWFIYPEFRKNNSLFTVLKQNKFIISILLIFIFWTTGFFTIGKLLAIPEKTYEYIFVKKVEEKIIQKNFNPSVREFIQDIIIKDCKIEHSESLKKLPNEVFFTIVEETNKHNIPHIVLFKVIDHESGFEFISNKQGSGAMGYCQIMPSTYHLFKDRAGLKKHNPTNNIKMGAYLLKDRYNYYQSKGESNRRSWFLSLRDYAGGKEELAHEVLNLYK